MNLAKCATVSVLLLSGWLHTQANPIFHSSTFASFDNSLHRYKQIPLHSKQIERIQSRKVCGLSFKHTGGLVLDKSDMEAKMYVEGTISRGKLILKLGDIKERDVFIKNILLPIETINYKCIHIRQTNLELPIIICLDNKTVRNFWINSITDAVLCYETKVRGKLPDNVYAHVSGTAGDTTTNPASGDTTDRSSVDITSPAGTDTTNPAGTDTTNPAGTDSTDLPSDNPLEERTDAQETNNGTTTDRNSPDRIDSADDTRWNYLKEEYGDDMEPKNKEKGLRLRIGKSRYGYPKVKINGTYVEELAQAHTE